MIKRWKFCVPLCFFHYLSMCVLQEEREERERQEKVRLALEKMKEARVLKVGKKPILTVVKFDFSPYVRKVLELFRLLL